MVRVPTNRIATHPGALLLEQIREMELSVSGVARDIHLPATRLHEIVHERRGVTAETAIALGAYFGQTPEFWMNAQTAYELSKELVKNGEGIRSRIRRHAQDRTSGEPLARS
jgi:addiction module HigA family antidote